MSGNKGQVKRKAVKLAIPQPGENAAERKRVLNVLAQRRYRQRRKEHIKKLEAQAADVNGDPNVFYEQSPQPRSPTKSANADGSQIDTGSQPSQPSFQTPDISFEDSACDYPFETAGEPASFPALSDAFPNYDAYSFASMATEEQALWDTSVLLPSLPSTPLSSSKHTSSSKSDTWSLTPVPAVQGSPGTGQTTPQAQSMFDQEMTYSFPDEAHLEMAELTLLRGCMAIARRMKVQDIIWSLTATSPFADPSTSLAQFSHLPSNLQPTLIQMTIPHHPVIDLLPWPQARNRMIQVLSQPPEFRPPGAASPMALLDFVYDLEDSAEGVRISGSNPYSEMNWEVGEKVFKSWWWILDRDIVQRSNELRASRGAPMLGSGSILGEVV
ncbi:uncharacterized protein Z520_07346 [Fonsecaea multimorphosa CBS 102226]|uniref:BZIP domain-containing protein n=1 Tax=Fonsecaea multimorphosa CBS 102226 TaxID=1442371 RepID=A0A0D2IJJ0_9EURO|nr:uncharacterized protein Z520_07346 [Fonsecaea multimorphosa CBS 102226]KIX97231.1 hypothetical protein Z520_07346 [Fonsecaea multimorphosa CBS 102226]OAL23002.1 hypothetical protein AYO22_06910 [Fonsecaea multimorphosa]